MVLSGAVSVLSVVPLMSSVVVSKCRTSYRRRLDVLVVVVLSLCLDVLLLAVVVFGNRLSSKQGGNGEINCITR